ncbi:MAG: replication protein C [Candidatus Syntrophoarchaeum caldarius]|uniref:Replication factor C large subunit n=1 Tax=Candidatus Syntropharchaeum caldarium TaxID=1838285 RepID=A0A1F2P899_9EURY|nr:MAG: replication protein C [Candidatus Syntrophoarchaeum caldarius]
MLTTDLKTETGAWVEKYRPVTLAEVVGNDKAKGELIRWAESWREGKPEKRATILYGSAGVGKTSAAYALAHDFGWEVIELNASDQRTATVIKKVAGLASRSRGLFEGGLRLIILDEADNIHGTADFGGSRELLKIVRTTQNPIILTANDLYGIPRALKVECETIQFRAIRKTAIVAQLRRICKNEGITCDELALKELAEGKNDLRSAINDLQAIAEGKERITVEDLATGIRDKRNSIFNFLSSLFREGDIEDVYKASFEIDETPEALIHWIDENLPRQFPKELLVYGMDWLSKSDRFLGRVKKRQNYRFWRYASFLMICGTILTHTGSGKFNRTFTRYQPPSHFRRISASRGRKKEEIELGLKIAKATHTSETYSRQKLIPLLRLIFTDREKAAAVTAAFGLDQNDLLLIFGSKGKREAKEVLKLSKAISARKAPSSEISDMPSPEPAPASTKTGEKKKESSSGQKTLFDFG